MKKNHQEIILGYLTIFFALVGILYIISLIFGVNFAWVNLWIPIITIFIVRIIGKGINLFNKT